MQKTSDAAPTLAELSAKATGGKWYAPPYAPKIPVQDAVFVVALVNAYRAGKLREVS